MVVCGWCAGDSFHQQAQAHLEALRKTLDLLETLHQEISFRRSDLNLLCRKLIQDGQLPPETVSLQTLEPFPSLTLEERTRFSECFSGLGRLEAEQECRRLELYQAQFQAALQEGEAAARTQSMLSHKLGLARRACSCHSAGMNQLKRRGRGWRLTLSSKLRPLASLLPC